MTEEVTREAIAAAARVMNDRGINISLPWEGDLDDLERERYEALVAAIAAAKGAAPSASGRGTVAEWRNDGFGKERHALYLGGLYVGSIMESTHPKYKPNHWRGWFMSNDDGDETGWFATADEARASVETALLASAPAPSPDDGWVLVQHAKPKPHAKYHVRRNEYIHTATPCYGMHAPWWVPVAISGNEYEPTNMLDTDEWRPLPPPPGGGGK